MMIRLLTIAAIFSLLLTGCMKNATEADKDGEEFRRDATESNDRARFDTTRAVAKANERMEREGVRQFLSNMEDDKILTEAESEAMISKAKADYDAAMMQAKGRYQRTKGECDGLSTLQNEICIGHLDETLTADRLLAAENRDTAIVSVQYRK